MRRKDFEDAGQILQEHQSQMINEISEYDISRSFLALYEWLQETSDRTLSDRLGVEPGDMHRIVETGEWLAYSLYEIAKLQRREDLLAELYNLRKRIRYGVKEELLPLVAFEGIGRVRARALYAAGLTDASLIAKASQAKLAGVSKIGPAVAKKIKDQVGRRRPE
jgi:helicase